MATRVLGIDLGAYSVKVIVANPGFRHASVTDFIERPIPPGDDPVPARAVRVLGEIIREHKLEGDMPYAAVAGDQVFIRILEFPFRSLRRPELEKAVGGELEGILPIDLEEMVYAFEPLPRDVVGSSSAPDDAAAGAEVSEQEPTFVQAAAAAPVVPGPVAPPAEGMRVLACAMRRDRARELLGMLDAEGAEPRGLVAAPASYMRVAEGIAACQPSRSGGPPVAIVDIGHHRTDVCVVKEGRAIFARTVARGGRDVTEAIARAWGLPHDQAEAAKHQDGFIASALEPAPSEAWQRIHEVILGVMRPLARDLRQTLTACRAKTGALPDRVVLLGGGSRLRGTASFLSEKLGMPVTLVMPQDNDALLGPRLAAAGVGVDLAALAAGVAFEGATGRPGFDLRQGELAYKADLSFVRAKLPQLAAAVLVVMAFAIASTYAKYYRLRKEEKVLSERLALATTEAFGKALSPSDALARAAGHTSGSGSPLPKETAYDVLLDINKKMPARDKATIDVNVIDIKPGKVTIEATAQSTDNQDALTGLKALEKSVKSISCFKDVQGGGDISSGPNNTKSFNLTITSDCM